MWDPQTRLADILAQHGLDQIVVPYLPVGWTKDALIEQIDQLASHGLAHSAIAPLSQATWPHAKAGFFGVKKKINAIMQEVGINGSRLL